MRSREVISVNVEKCNNCHACISVCPVKNCIDATGDTVGIIDERCLACGRCVRACKHDARSYFEDTAFFMRDLAAGVPMIAILAPATVSVFPDTTRLIGFLKQSGVAAAFDVSFGAELCVHSMIRYAKTRKPKMMINSSCPVIVTYCEVYKPNLLPYLIPVQSPMLHTAIMIREFFPQYANHKIAALSPCTAKKREFIQEGGIDYNVTLSELRNYIIEKKINLKKTEPAQFDGPQAERGVSFSTPGGLHELLLRSVPDFSKVRRIQGISTYTYLNELPDMMNNGCNPVMIDCLNCARGCNGGPGTPNRERPLDMVEYPVLRREADHIKRYNKTIDEEIAKYWREGLYDRSFRDQSYLVNDMRNPSSEELWNVFKEMGKYNEQDILNCAACGYGSCARMAEAIFNKLNKTENCSHYLRVKAEAASETKTNFLATMSHEIRTPLNSIIGLTEIELQKKGVPVSVKENLEKILISGSSLLGIINDILDISKIETGKLELVGERYDVASLINDAVQLHVLRIAEKPVEFKLNIADNIPAILHGDELRVKQILNNLLSNAFKYTRRGEVTLDISFRRGVRAEDPSYLCFCVNDTGIGIKKADICKLFSEYSQLDTKANRRIEGTGLGLAITKKLVDMIGGEISVESDYGIGSKFTVSLRQKIACEHYINAETIKNLKSFSFTSMKVRRFTTIHRMQMPYGRVLVVDDVQTNLDVARGLISTYGIKVDTAASGQEAVYRIRDGATRYDAVFIDYMMPVMDGIATGIAIKQDINSDYARGLPLIALTADAISGNKEKFLQAGFADFISKPIDMTKLDEVLRKYVYNREKDAALFGSVSSAPVSSEEDIPCGGGDDVRIPGVNYDEALTRFGNEKIYLDIVRSFVRNTPAMLEKTKTVTSRNLNDYAIIVHGIKGTSRAIGAEEIGLLAEELERAAKNKLSGFCITGNRDFQRRAEKLIRDLEGYLDEHCETETKPFKDAPDPALLKRLKAASEGYNMTEMDAIMEDLESFTYGEDNEKILRIRDYIDNSDFSALNEML